MEDRKTVGRSSADTVRDILALVTVIGFVLITAILAIAFPLLALAPPDKMINYLKDLSSIYSGIVGLIIGFYFGKP
jgi:hypothetical protein